MKNIESVLNEKRVFEPTAEFAAGSTLGRAQLAAMRAKAAEDYVGFWADMAVAEIVWQKPFTIPLDDSQAPNYRWFTDGQLNVSYNCLDVHLADRAGQTAIHFEGEPGEVRTLTYAQLHREVCRFANALKARGIGKGDRVVIYMPLIPEAVIAMQACARIGAVHSVVFGGFAAKELATRIDDAEPKVILTASCGIEPGRIVQYKPLLDEAIALSQHKPGACLILQHGGEHLRFSQQPVIGDGALGAGER